MRKWSEMDAGAAEYAAEAKEDAMKLTYDDKHGIIEAREDARVFHLASLLPLHRATYGPMFAAAPELLDAARRALVFLQDNGLSHGADLARAIARAEGR